MSEHENEPVGAAPEQPQPQPQPQRSTAPESTGQGIPAEQRQWAMFSHLSALTGIFTGVGAILGPLIIWLVQKETMPFVDDQAKEALNFNITVGIVMLGLVVVGSVLMVILIGFLFYLLIPVVFIYWMVMTVIAAMKSNEGIAYRYPMTIRLVS